LADVDVRRVPRWDLADAVRTSRQGRAVRNESADEKAASPSNRMEVPSRFLSDDDSGRRRTEWSGSPASSKSSQLECHRPDCQQSGNKYPKLGESDSMQRKHM
jgi:hypothetical protein